MKSLLRKLMVALALAVLFSPTYPVLAALLKKPSADAELAAIQAEYSDITPSVNQLQ
jgi:hypothetical protein